MNEPQDNKFIEINVAESLELASKGKLLYTHYGNGRIIAIFDNKIELMWQSECYSITDKFPSLEHKKPPTVWWRKIR